MSSWRNRLARSTVNREVVGSIPTEDVLLFSESLVNVLEQTKQNSDQHDVGDRCLRQKFSEIRAMLTFRQVKKYLRLVKFRLKIV